MQVILPAQMVNHDHSFFQDLDLQEPNGKLNIVIRTLINEIDPVTKKLSSISDTQLFGLEITQQSGDT